MATHTLLPAYINDTKKAEKINIPKQLSPDEMEKQLSKITPKKSRTFPTRGILVAAAACLFVLIGGITMKSYLSPDPTSHQQKVIADNQRTLDSLGYDNAYEVIAEYQKQTEKDVVPEKATSASEESTGNDDIMEKENVSDTAKQNIPDYSDTDLQVKGVMEGDIVKTDGNYLYTLQDNSTGSKITIYRVKGKDVTKVSDIELENGTTQEMYLAKNRLILIHSLWCEDNSEETCGNINYNAMRDATEIVIYDTSNPQSPRKLRTQTQSGRYSTSRVADDYLYTFTSYLVKGDNIKKEKPETYIPLVNGKCMEEKDVRCVSNESDNQYMVMTSLPLDGSSAFTSSICSLGGAEVYYVSNENIYSSKCMWNHDSGEQYTIITKYSYNKGNFHFVAKRRVRGLIKDSYYLHEYKGNLCYVYTRYQTSGTTTNGIVTLDADLKKLGEIENLGKDERIYSSYYMDNIAYFVTYRETDPVFAVDVSNPKKLRLLSELKLPGFSSYLHSFGKGLLLGIGEQIADNEQDWDSCAKLSVFSIKDNKDLKERTKKLLQKNGNKDIFDYSETFAAQNHKAVFVDEERKLVGFGIHYDSYDDNNRNACYEVYSYADNKLTKILSQQNISSYCDVRGLRIGNYFYVVEPGKSITVYDMPDAGQTKPMKKRSTL